MKKLFLLLMISLFAMVASGCMAKATIKTPQEFSFYNKAKTSPDAPPTTVYLDLSGSDGGKEISAYIGAKLEPILTASTKFKPVKSEDGADLRVKIKTYYFGTNPGINKGYAKISKGPSENSTGLDANNILSGSTQLAGQGIVLASIKGLSSINPITGLAVALTGKFIEMTEDMGSKPRPFYTKTIVRIEEDAVGSGSDEGRDLNILNVPSVRNVIATSADAATDELVNLITDDILNVIFTLEEREAFVASQQVALK